MTATRYKYTDHSYAEEPLVAFRAGKIGEPEVVAAGGTLASGTITFADNPTAADTITIDGVVVEFTAAASDATTAGTIGDPLLVNIKVSTDLTLDEILVVCNSGTVPAAMQLATYTEDGATILTITYDSYGLGGNLFTLAASSDTVSGAFLTGGQTLINLTVVDGPTDLALTQNVNQQMGLLDGDEAQRKFVFMSLQDGTGDAVITPDNLTGGTTITFGAVGEYSELRFMNGTWIQTAGTATVA